MRIPTRLGTHIHTGTQASTDSHAHTLAYTHREMIIIIAFPQQQWFRERSPLLRYTYISCLCLIYKKPGQKEKFTIFLITSFLYHSLALFVFNPNHLKSYCQTLSVHVIFINTLGLCILRCLKTTESR